MECELSRTLTIPTFGNWGSEYNAHMRQRVDRCSPGTVRTEWWVKNRMMDEKIFLISHEACGSSPTSSDLETGRNNVAGRGWWQKKKRFSLSGWGKWWRKFYPTICIFSQGTCKNAPTSRFVSFWVVTAQAGTWCSSKCSCCSMGKACSLFWSWARLLIWSVWFTVKNWGEMCYFVWNVWNISMTLTMTWILVPDWLF